MSTAEEASYPATNFLVWLRKHGYGPVAARGRGCRNLNSLARPEDRVGERLAQEWADAMGADMDDIWPEGPVTAPAPMDAGLSDLSPADAVAAPGWPFVRSEPGPIIPFVRPGVDLVVTTGAASVPDSPKAARPGKALPEAQRNLPVRNGYAACPVCGVPKRVKISLPAHLRAAHPEYVGPVPMPSVAAPELVECPVDGCKVQKAPGVAVRNHVRHAHAVDPDTIFGVPGYRSRGPLSAQQIGSPKPYSGTQVVSAPDVVAVADGLRLGTHEPAVMVDAALPPGTAELRDASGNVQARFTNVATDPRPQSPSLQTDLHAWRLRYLDLLVTLAAKEPCPATTDILVRIERQLDRLNVERPVLSSAALPR